ncbi:MAG: hypothetical protein GVY05_05665 [Bacteroidetes bacterium]|jgi:hypothetical protein|nr:hypothetical protein [Bacteroidota bacterium]
MKSLELKQMEKISASGCTKTTTEVLLATGVLVAAVATGGAFAIVAAGLSFAFVYDDVENGACEDW